MCSEAALLLGVSCMLSEATLLLGVSCMLSEAALLLGVSCMLSEAALLLCSGCRCAVGCGRVQGAEWCCLNSGLQLVQCGGAPACHQTHSLRSPFCSTRALHPSIATGATVQCGPEIYCFSGKQLRALAHLMRRVGLVLWQQALLFPQVGQEAWEHVGRQQSFGIGLGTGLMGLQRWRVLAACTYSVGAPGQEQAPALPVR